MRMSDWSSDVCSSDLAGQRVIARHAVDLVFGQPGFGNVRPDATEAAMNAVLVDDRLGGKLPPARLLIDHHRHHQIGERGLAFDLIGKGLERTRSHRRLIVAEWKRTRLNSSH